MSIRCIVVCLISLLPSSQLLSQQLINAAHKNDLQAVRKLLKGGADPNQPDIDGNTALIRAMDEPGFSGSPEKVIKELLKAKARVNDRNNEGRTAITYVRRPELLRILLDARADIHSIDKYEWSVLSWARYNLLRHRYLNQEQVVSELEKAGAKSNPSVDLLIAAEFGVEARFAPLVAAGASLSHRDKQGRTALLLACSSRSPLAPLRLIELGADVQSKANDGATCMHHATHASVLRELAKRGAEVDAVRKDGYTPLISKSSYHNLEGIRVLLELGASVDARTPNGVTPLRMAVWSGHSSSEEDRIRCLDLLSANKANLNAQTDDGTTPLMSAASRGETRMVGRLLSLGASSLIKDRQGRLARDRAQEGLKEHLSQPAWRRNQDPSAELRYGSVILALETAAPMEQGRSK